MSEASKRVLPPSYEPGHRDDIEIPRALTIALFTAEVELAEIEWKELPTPMWPGPAAYADFGDLVLEVSSPEGVPTWELYRNTGSVEFGRERIAGGTADTLGAAKAAALFEAEAASGAE